MQNIITKSGPRDNTGKFPGRHYTISRGYKRNRYMGNKREFFRPISIQKALYYTVLLALIPAITIITISEWKRARQWEDIVAQEAQNQANSVAALQHTITESTRQMLATLAKMPEFITLKETSITPILKNLHAQNDAYLNFTVVDSTGIVVASSLLKPGISLKGRPHIERVLQTAEFSPGSYILGLVDNTPSFSYAYPILDDQGGLVGAIAATYKLSSYQQYMKDLEKADKTILGIVDRYGTRLFFYPPMETNPVGKPIKYEVWNRIQQGPDQDVFLTAGSDGIERFYGYRKLRTTPDKAPYMFVIYGIPYGAVTERVLPILYQELGLIILVMALAFGIASLSYTTLFGRRLQQLLDLTVRIQEENLTIPELPADPTPDLGRIQKAVVSMLTSLAHQKETQESYERELNKAIQEKNMLIKEVHHRVKNDFQLIISMVRLESESCNDIQAFREAMESRISSMSLVHQMLYETEAQGFIDLGSYGEKIMELVIGIKDSLAPVSIDVQAETILAPLDKAITFGLLLNELVMNSLKHGLARNGESCFSLHLSRQEHNVRFMFKDNGPGLPAHFSPEESKGLGMQLAMALAEQLGGNLSFETHGGARFYVEFPLASDK